MEITAPYTALYADCRVSTRGRSLGNAVTFSYTPVQNRGRNLISIESGFPPSLLIYKFVNGKKQSFIFLLTISKCI